MPARHVLVVDDEPRFAEVVSSALRSVGHEVRVAGSRTEFNLELAERPYALILVDYRLGRDNGLELIAALEPSIRSRCIIRSAALTPDVANAAAGLGVFAMSKSLGRPFLEFVAQRLEIAH
jgi:CheY-like chemotaxis protein